jgi:DNA-binding transcriptional regulator YiaG
MNTGEQMAPKATTEGRRFSPEKFEKLRERKGITRRQISDALGVTEGTVYNWGAGKTRPDVDQYLKMAALLDADPRDLTVSE